MEQKNNALVVEQPAGSTNQPPTAPIALFERMAILKDWIEPISKSAILIAAICYAAGFIVINSYFSHFGYYSLDFFRSSYISAGAWALLYLGICFFYTSIIAAIPKNLKLEKKLSLRISLIALSIIAVPSLPMFLFGLLSADLNSEGISILIPFALGTLSAILWHIFNLFNKSGTTNKIIAGPNPEHLQYFLFAIALTLVYFFSFGQKIYSLIPVHFGGGKPNNVLIICNDQAQGVLELSGIRVYNGSRFAYLDSSMRTKAISEPVGMLAETSDGYTVLVTRKDSTKAVTFSKRLASAIVHANSVVVGTLQ